MLLGIDVGGTFTDAVILEAEQVARQAKVPTTHNNVLEGILKALDIVLEGIGGSVERVVISSTIITNALTENALEPVFLGIIPGPGRNYRGQFPVEPYIFSGYVDHAGKVTAPLGKEHNLHGLGTVGAVSGKFAVREPQLEHLLAHRLQQGGMKQIFLGSELSGELNFIRRTNSAYFSAQTYYLLQDFCAKVQAAMRARGLNCPVQILKADGGTMPLDQALKQGVEAVLTGPAASALGIEALAAPNVKSISLDVGGTTTDIAFWDRGRPLMGAKGAVLKGYPTAVRSFHMRSVGIGGDSKITKLAHGTYKVGPERIGPAVAVGGKEPTLSDALIVAGYVSFGDYSKAQAAMATFGQPQAEARAIVREAVRQLQQAIKEMLEEWAQQPVYTVDDVLKGSDFVPEQLIGVGGGAPGLIKALGEAMELPVTIPLGAMVANAIGAAVARPTLAVSLRADTGQGYYLIPEGGIREPIRGYFDQGVAEGLLSAYLLKASEAWRLPEQTTELISSEHFSVVKNYYESADLYNLRMQLEPGIICKVVGREVNI